MSDIADLSLPDPIFFGPTFEAVPDAELTIEDAHYVQSDSDAVQPDSDAVQYVFFCWMRDAQTAAFETALDDDETIAEWSRLAAFDDRALYRIGTAARPESEAPLVYPLCRRHDLTVLDSKRDAAGFHLRVRAPNREALRAFRSALSDRGAPVELSRITSAEGSTAERSGLTEKQVEALSLAFERGYFATPKAVTLTELAEEFGTTRQTLSHHVRSAVETVVAQTVPPQASTASGGESA